MIHLTRSHFEKLSSIITVFIVIQIGLSYWKAYQDQKGPDPNTPSYQQALREYDQLRVLANQYLADPSWSFIGKEEFFIGAKKISESINIESPIFVV